MYAPALQFKQIKVDENDQKALLTWYQAEKRELPWRRSQDPYLVWISETMLQQTTSEAVAPFYQRFTARFKSLKDLACAPIEEVLEMWAGLGYYSRARNLHRAAVELSKLESFPQNYEDLIKFPGFGPYTSRAVASLAFGQKVGVLDGNVIRVLTRFHGLKYQWWKSNEKQFLQDIADSWVQGLPSNLMNQGLMELGKMICRPSSPKCWKCPIQKRCEAKKLDIVSQLPLQKPKRSFEIWHWNVSIHKEKELLLLIKNQTAPFLKNQWIFPGSFKKLKTRPKKFAFKHSITHHQIYVTVDSRPAKSISTELSEVMRCRTDELKKLNPSSLMEKVLHHSIIEKGF